LTSDDNYSRRSKYHNVGSLSARRVCRPITYARWRRRGVVLLLAQAYFRGLVERKMRAAGELRHPWRTSLMHEWIERI